MADSAVIRIFDTTLRDGEQSPGATMTTEEKSKGTPKPRDYMQYLRAFEDELGWRFVNDMCDGVRTFHGLRKEFAEELRGIQHGPLRSIWERFAYEADCVRNT